MPQKRFSPEQIMKLSHLMKTPLADKRGMQFSGKRENVTGKEWPEAAPQ
jgi:hypothetical protein